MLILERWADHEDHGTFGRLYHDGRFLADTIERPWLNNRRNVSCIPAGTYDLEQTIRGSGYETFALVNFDIGVTRYNSLDSLRFAILIHPGNFASDVEGCIACGKGISSDGGRLMLTGGTSRATTEEVLDYIRGNHIHQISIIWRDHTWRG